MSKYVPLVEECGGGEEEDVAEAKEEEEECCSGGGLLQVAAELKKDFKLAGPMMLSLLLSTGMGSSNQMFAGHLSSLELSAMALASSVISTFTTALLSGLVSAQETLSGQAFGAGQVRLLGIYLQRSWIILIAAAFILSPVYIYAAPILKLLGQHEEVAGIGGKFAVRIIPHLFGLALSTPTQKFLQSQRKLMVLAWIGLFALLIHVGLLCVFVSVFGWGLDGVAAAHNISSWVVAIAQVTYIIGWCKDAWIGLSWSAFRDIWPFVRLSLASAISTLFNDSFSIVLMLLIGHLNDAVLAVGAFTICMNIAEWAVTVATGMNVAASVRVSNELGSARPQAAKYAILVTSLTSLAIGVVCAATVIATRNQFAVLFTNDEELQKFVAKDAYFLAATIVITSFQTPLTGATVGAGLQVATAYIALVSCYLFGIPVAVVLGYVSRGGLQGVWSGTLCGLVVQLVSILILLGKKDWKEEAARALSRVKAYGG